MLQSAVEIARRIRDRSLSSEEVVAAHLGRIDKINPQINAVVAVSKNAIEQARQADAGLARGDRVGPLHGVPMTIKDCFDTAGLISTWGTIGRRTHVPDKDATVVKRLKEAGAILIGKTNTPELTLSYSTWNKIHGFTRNPFDVTRSPGGSSGGAAASITAGLSSFDIGTDFAGSIRVPSHFCGNAGIKPTSGSVPRTGLCLPPGMMVDFMSHVGPMARKVEDLRLLLPIIWGPDGIDSLVAPLTYRDPLDVETSGLRCGVMMDNGIVSPSEETKAAIQSISDLLDRAGLRVEPVRLDGIEETPEIAAGYWGVGSYVAIRKVIRDCGTRYEDIADLWLREPQFEGHDAGEQLESWRANIDAVSANLLAKQMVRAEAYRSRLLRHMSQFDVLISPVTANPAPKLPEPGAPPFGHGEASYSQCFNLTGWPSGVLRASTSSEGMPIGVQITANAGREDIVLAVMELLENELPEFAGPTIGSMDTLSG